MLKVVRLLVAVVATLVLLGGLATILAGARLEGLYLAGLGAVGLIVVVFERQRYGLAPEERHANAERHRPTEEVFTDPTTGERTRVWIDPQSGERSYRAE
jgi:hypothetical protein